jgi:hypothetical protein
VLQNPPQGPKFAADGLKHLADQIGDALRREKQQQLAEAPSTPDTTPPATTSWPPHGRTSRPRAQVMLDEILSLEGGLSNNRYDSGGLTNYGVTQQTLDDWRLKNSNPKLTGIPESVRDLTVGQARALLQDTSYDDYQLDRIKDYDAARHIFDMFINTKPGPVRDFVYGAIDDVMRRQSLYDEHHAPLADLPSKRVGPQGIERINWLVDHGFKTALQDALVDRRRAHAEKQPNYDKFPGLLPRIERFRPPNHPPEGWYD